MSKAEKFISDCTRKCSNLMQVPTLDDKGNIVPEAHPWLTPEEARKAMEIAREEILQEVKENLLNMLNTSIDNEHFFEQLDDYIEELENKQ